MNELFRDHVTSVGFNLSLGKTHIAALVELDHKLKLNLPLGYQGIDYSVAVRGSRGRLPRAFAHNVPARIGLEARGLVEHLISMGDHDWRHLTPRQVWRITPAGRLVINLLKEAGLYQEYAGYLPPLPTTQAELKALRDTLSSYSREQMAEYGQKLRSVS